MATELKATGKCDFCPNECNAGAFIYTDEHGSTQYSKAYDCEDFILPATGLPSYGAWGACPHCAALIEAGNWDGLVERMASMYAERSPFLPAQIAKAMMIPVFSEQIRLFRQNRKPQ